MVTSISQSTTSVRPNVLQLLVDNSADGLYIVDRERDVFLRVNPALCEISGYSEEELLSESFRSLDLVHSDDKDSVVAMREAAMFDQARQQMRFRLVTKNNQTVHVECRMRIVYNMGRLVSVGACRDISELVRLEMQSRVKSDSTSTKVRESSRAMLEVANANNRLYQMVESLKAVPELSKELSKLDNVNDVIKTACLYLTNQEHGLQFGSCVLYLRRANQLEVAYANPFRMTTTVQLHENENFRKLLGGETDLIITDTGNRLVPIHDRDNVIGVLEVGIGRTLERIFAQDDPVRRAQENVVKAIADFIGSQIANLQLRERIQLQVIEDKLTGLYNRRHFDDKLVSEFKRAARYNRSLALMLLDIDHFKKVNDTHGHPQGDAVLQAIGKLLGTSFRDLDTVCRAGGEEFTVILPETPLESAAQKAESLRKAVEAMAISMHASKVPHTDTDRMNITVSIGVACVNPTIEDAEHLYKEADRALYIAKNGGRNRVCMA